MFYCFSGGLLTIVSANVGSYEWSPWLRFSMTEDLDERTYDLLRLIRRYEPIGSIRLVTLMERHGYSIQGRTIRLTLSDLDERGMTEKVPGKGRRLTTSGQEALETGNVGSRLEQIRSRIATLTSQVTYDPVEDTVDIERFALDAVRVDCRGLDPRSPIGPAMLPTTDADILVVQTGWDEHWGTEAYFDHPFLTPDAAELCVDQGYDLAIDALNVDPTPTDNAAVDEPEGFQVHHALLGTDRLIFENLTNLATLPERFELLAFPLKLTAGDGAPVRAVARWD